MTELERALELSAEGRFKEAFALFDSLSASGHIYAMVELARMLENGIGATRDLVRARELYAQAAQSDSLFARFRFATFLIGQGEKYRALSEMKKLTDEGYLPAIYWLGRMLVEGAGEDTRGQEGRDQGLYYLDYAAENGHIWAARFLVSADFRSANMLVRGLAAKRLIMLAFRGAWIAWRDPDDNRIRR